MDLPPWGIEFNLRCEHAGSVDRLPTVALRRGMKLSLVFEDLVRRVADVSKQAGDWFAAAIKTSEKATKQHQNTITEKDRLGKAPLEQLSHTEMPPQQPSPTADVDAPAREFKEFEFVEMHPRHRGESVAEGGTVRYLTAAERMELELTVRDGKLYNRHGEPFDTGWSAGGRPAIWVMDRDGSLYASKYWEIRRFHHSSFVKGQPVAGAGTIAVADGYIVQLTDSSGHYLPSRRHTIQVVKHLRSLGLRIDDDCLVIQAD